MSILNETSDTYESVKIATVINYSKLEAYILRGNSIPVTTDPHWRRFGFAPNTNMQRYDGRWRNGRVCY